MMIHQPFSGPETSSLYSFSETTQKSPHIDYKQPFSGPKTA